MRKVKEFVKLLKRINPEAEFSTGNFCYYRTSGMGRKDYANIDGDTLKLCKTDKKIDLKKVKYCVLWCSE